jgi:hypothetical protein
MVGTMSVLIIVAILIASWLGLTAATAVTLWRG